MIGDEDFARQQVIALKGAESVLSLSKRARMGEATLREWLAGKTTLTLEKLEGLSEALGVETWRLFSDHPELTAEEREFILEWRAASPGYRREVKRRLRSRTPGEP